MPACDFVCERNLVARIGTQVGVRLEVTGHFRYLGGSRNEIREDFLWQLVEREVVTPSIQRSDYFIEAQEIADQGQILAVTGLIGVGECSGHDVTKFRNI